MKSKSRILLISTIIIFILTIFIGTSYSLWQTINTQDSVNTATTKCFNVEITSQKNSISLENAYPITNEKGKKLTPFSFTITNTCDIFASYTVSLESLKGTTLSSKFLNAMINNEEIKKLSDYEATDTVNTSSIESHILAKGSLGSGDSEDYTLRVWIDYDTTMEDLNNETKTFKSKIVVKAQPSNWSPVDEGYTTLHDAILANEYQSSPEVAIKKIEAKGTPDLSKTAPIMIWNEKNSGIATTTTVKPSQETINSDEATSSLDKNANLLYLYTDYSFDTKTGKYTLINGTFLDTDNLDFENNNYYYIQDIISIDNTSGKLNNIANKSDVFMYKVKSISKTNSRKNWNGKEYNSITYKINGEYYTQSEEESNNSDKGIYASEDDFGTTYYYRGNVKNNNIKVGNYNWKIIRINGDGSIRLLYSGKNNVFDSIGNSCFNKSYRNPAYVGYMYGNDFMSYDNAVANENNSSIKSRVDEWFENNILSSSIYTLISDNGFCNDRKLQTGDGYSTSSYTYYQAHYRSSNNIASFKCSNPDNDLFTTSNSLYGNKALTYPIGLITYDELVFAGMTMSSLNKLSYVYTDYSYWTMTPYRYSSYENFAFNYKFSPDGFINDWGWITNTIGIRPVINLKADVKISGGIGTINDPYVVE